MDIIDIVRQELRAAEASLASSKDKRIAYKMRCDELNRPYDKDDMESFDADIQIFTGKVTRHQTHLDALILDAERPLDQSHSQGISRRCECCLIVISLLLYCSLSSFRSGNDV